MHTTGPWYVEVGLDETRVEAFTQTVATNVSNCDAALISAAPELLAALSGMIELWEVNESNSYCSACEAHAPCDTDGDPLAEIIHKPDCPVDKARAAIAKATGKEGA